MQYDKIYHRKVSLSSCHLNGHTIGFVRKVLISSFHLNGHTLGFRAQTQKLEPHLLSNLLIPSTDPNLIVTISFQRKKMIVFNLVISLLDEMIGIIVK